MKTSEEYTNLARNVASATSLVLWPYNHMAKAANGTPPITLRASSRNSGTWNENFPKAAVEKESALSIEYTEKVSMLIATAPHANATADFANLYEPNPKSSSRPVAANRVIQCRKALVPALKHSCPCP